MKLDPVIKQETLKMHHQEIEMNYVLDKTHQSTESLGDQYIYRVVKKGSIICDKQANRTNEHSSIIKQCLAAIIGKCEYIPYYYHLRKY